MGGAFLLGRFSFCWNKLFTSIDGNIYFPKGALAVNDEIKPRKLFIAIETAEYCNNDFLSSSESEAFEISSKIATPSAKIEYPGKLLSP